MGEEFRAIQKTKVCLFSAVHGQRVPTLVLVKGSENYRAGGFDRQHIQAEKKFHPPTHEHCLTNIYVRTHIHTNTHTYTQTHTHTGQKSQFHSGSSAALTRSGGRQEFVSPPNLEITFSLLWPFSPSLTSLHPSLHPSLPFPSLSLFL